MAYRLRSLSSVRTKPSISEPGTKYSNQFLRFITILNRNDGKAGVDMFNPCQPGAASKKNLQRSLFKLNHQLRLYSRDHLIKVDLSYYS
jgi:hypothetical protein